MATRKGKHHHKYTQTHVQEKSIQIRLGDHWQYSIPQPRHANASFSHMYTLSLSRSSRFWLTFPCSPWAKPPQDREKQKNTQTNDKFTTSQTSVSRSGWGQWIKRKTVREVKRVSFQTLWRHPVADMVYSCYSAMADLDYFQQTCVQCRICMVPFGSHLFLKSAVHLQDWQAKTWQRNFTITIKICFKSQMYQPIMLPKL